MNELYQSFSSAVREELSRYEEQAIIPAGGKLISKDVIPEHLIAIEQGSVEISVPYGRRAMPLSVAGPGKVLGLQPIVAGALPAIEATTLEPCKVSLIARQKFLEMLHRRPEIYVAIAKVLSTDLNAVQRFLRGASRPKISRF